MSLESELKLWVSLPSGILSPLESVNDRNTGHLKGICNFGIIESILFLCTTYFILI